MILFFFHRSFPTNCEIYSFMPYGCCCCYFAFTQTHVLSRNYSSHFMEIISQWHTQELKMFTHFVFSSLHSSSFQILIDFRCGCCCCCFANKKPFILFNSSFTGLQSPFSRRTMTKGFNCAFYTEINTRLHFSVWFRKLMEKKLIKQTFVTENCANTILPTNKKECVIRVWLINVSILITVVGSFMLDCFIFRAYFSSLLLHLLMDYAFLCWTEIEFVRGIRQSVL